MDVMSYIKISVMHAPFVENHWGESGRKIIFPAFKIDNGFIPI